MPLHDTRFTGPRPPRDPRIDFVRGVALLTIHADHMQSSQLGYFTPRNFGFSDMAEVFVFLSGYVCGLVYGPLLEARGLGACQRKAALRAAQLGLAWALTLLVIRLLDLAGFNLSDVPQSATALWRPVWRSGSPVDDPAGVFGILFLYFWLLLAMPAMLRLRARHWSLMFAVSLAVYAGSQLSSDPFRSIVDWTTLTAFNPFAWQFLFFLGATFASPEFRRRITIPGGWPAALMGGLLLEAAFVLKLLNPVWLGGLIDKSDLAPLRIVHLLALVVVGRWLLPASESGFWRRPVVRGFVLCGSNSLMTFCAGAVFALLGSRLIAVGGPGVLWQLTAVLGVWSGCMLAAWIWSRARRRRNPAATVR